MTTSVTIKNLGPHDRVNVNEVEFNRETRVEQTVNSCTLEIGQETTVQIWGPWRYLSIVETNDIDTNPLPLRPGIVTSEPLKKDATE